MLVALNSCPEMQREPACRPSVLRSVNGLDYWSYRVESLPASVPASDGACQEREVGYATWAHGSVACYRSSETRKAKVRWTDTRTNTYWLADADHMNVVRLARWRRDDRP